jgi:hypothetical protein
VYKGEDWGGSPAQQKAGAEDKSTRVSQKTTGNSKKKHRCGKKGSIG